MRNLRLRTKLTLFNLLSKIGFSLLFIAFMPTLTNRIILIHTDQELVDKREQVIGLISEIGIEPFIAGDTVSAFGSYNILKEEFISLERADLSEDWNFIEVSQREIDNQTIEYRVLNYSFNVDKQTYLLQIGKSLGSIMYSMRNTRNIIYLFLVFIILITLISDLFYTEKIVRPLSQIIKKLKNTSNPALFDRNPVKTTTSDFTKLDSAITELINKINVLLNKEREITVNISHELMTPISVLRGKLENISMNKNIDPEISEKIEQSLATLHRLKVLVNSLLFFARIESKQYLKNDTFKIADLLRDIYDELAPVAIDRRINIVTETEFNFLVREANRSLVFSMIYNVVNNAIKNAGDGGMVLIKSHSGAPGTGVSIVDSGKGIDPDEMKNLFSRAGKKIDPDKEGNGIGLAITKSIADFHEIDVSVASNPGLGTRFFFRFPEN